MKNSQKLIDSIFHFVILFVVTYLTALSTFLLFSDAIYTYCGGNLTVTGDRATAGIFATYPAPYISIQAGFIDQVAMTLDSQIISKALQITRSPDLYHSNPFHSVLVYIPLTLCVLRGVCPVRTRCLAQPCCCWAWWLCLTRGTSQLWRAASLWRWVFWSFSLASLWAATAAMLSTPPETWHPGSSLP